MSSVLHVTLAKAVKLNCAAKQISGHLQSAVADM